MFSSNYGILLILMYVTYSKKSPYIFFFTASVYTHNFNN